MALTCAGCKTTQPNRHATAPPNISSELAGARKLYAAGQYTDALDICNELARQDPLTPGLAQLRKKAYDALIAERTRVAQLRSDSGYRAAAADSLEKKSIPETYGIRRPIKGETSSLKTERSSIEQILELPVTLHFTNLPLTALVTEIGAAANVNIVVDADLAGDGGGGKTMAINADNVPLSEVFDFISRNLGVAFYAGQNIIWVTAQTERPVTVPMETRMYRLRKGISDLNLEPGSGVDEDDIGLLKAIELFVPSGGGDGSALYFDKNMHVLIVKNTRAKLVQIEDIIDTLDRTPPQILIEARFISTGVSDLRELGVDWSTPEAIVTSEKTVLEDGVAVKKPMTQIRGGDMVTFPDFPNQVQGLNLTYQGVLTAPKFELILHALQRAEKTRTLSVPRITTVNNFAANIHVGENFLYWTEFEPVSVRTGQDLQGRIQYEDRMAPVGAPLEKPLGITLEVTPTVGADLENITLRLKPRIDQFVRYEEQMVASRGASSANRTTSTRNSAGTTSNSFALLRLPIFQEQSMDTKVIVASGETVVLGGLITTVESARVDKVPLLGSIPILGKLFRHDGVEERNQNLLVFVTATIISQHGESLIPVR